MTARLNRIQRGNALQLIHGIANNSVDLIICDGPYGITNNGWDAIAGDIQTYNLNLIRLFADKLKSGGVLYLFGKSDCIDFIDYRPHLNLKRKIVWFQPSRLAQGRINYTNNYDLICYFVKGDKPNAFNLDAIRVSQIVDITQRRRCENVPSVINGTWGKTKFHNKGKNPGDVWGDIKQLTYKSKELVSRSALNTVQKPEALMRRLVLASSNEGDLVLDPFAGTGTVPAICVRHRRNFIAFEENARYVEDCNKRIKREQYLQRSASSETPEPI